MKKFADELRPASFRGVPFGVEMTELEAGRRVQVHEYPQRDKPFAQDMGKHTRRLEFDAFVVGADYIAQANALLAAVEKVGAGQLVHPWFGSMTVNALPCRVMFDKALSFAKFHFVFVESGALVFPAATSSTAALSRDAAAGLDGASQSWFAVVFQTLNQINGVAIWALNTYGKVLNFLANPVFALSSMLGFGTLPGNLSSLSALFGSPVSLAGSFSGLLNLVSIGKSLAGNDAILVPTVRGLTRMAVDPALANPVAPTSGSVVDGQIYVNQKAILGQARQALLVQAVGLSSYLACSVYNDVLALIAELSAALDAEMLLTDDDGVYQALHGARCAMFEDLSVRSRDSARLVSYTPDDVLPALVVAYNYYDDCGRGDEIVSRNKIVYPGFVPANALWVLSR